MGATCSHCGNNVSELKQYGASSFCCLGCSTAHTLINSLNLSEYYKYCNVLYGIKPTRVQNVVNELNYLEYVITQPFSQQYKVNLIIEGIRCGSCVWLVENALLKQTDGMGSSVISARINLSTKRITITWSGTAEYINTLVTVVERLGYRLLPFLDDENDLARTYEEKWLLKCLAVSGAVSAQVMMLAIAIWAGNMYGVIGEYTRSMLHWISAIITVPAVIYAGLPFFKSALLALKNRRSNMDVPISIATIATTIISIQETIFGNEYVYFDAAIGLIFVLLIGRYLDIRVRNMAWRKAHAIILSQPRSVTIEDDGIYKLISVHKAKPGQVAVVAVGERIAVDGIIISGKTEIDNSVITGETVPVLRDIGSEVLTGSINMAAPIKVEIKATGENTILAEIIRLIEAAEQNKSSYVRIADKMASWYTPAVLSVAIITLCIWYFLLSASVSQALLYAVTVLIITCPCAIGIAVPVVQVIASLRLMQKGILIKSSDALERATEVNTVLYDKTGTLTTGAPVFINVTDFSAEELKLIASMAVKSKHVLLQAILNTYFQVRQDLYDIDVQEEKGYGLKGMWKQVEILLGNKKWCCSKELEYNDEYYEIWFRIGDKCKRLIFSDELKHEAKEVVQKLYAAGFEQYIISGDRVSIVDGVAQALQIKKYFAALTPAEKYDIVAALQMKYGNVLMVGDGLNDAAALQQAYLSMSPASGLAIAQVNADIIFQNALSAIPETLLVARYAKYLVKQNFALAFMYNVLALPIAVSGCITPLIAAITMASSSMFVVLNAMRLTCKNLKEYK